MAGYKAIFFDLDGTLLPMNGELFIRRYFEELPQFLAKEGYENIKELVYAINEGTKAMFAPHDCVNEQAFWDCFCEVTGLSKDEFLPVMDRYYASAHYDNIGRDVEMFHAGIEAIETLKAKGYPLHLTTLPIFPRIGVESRLAWAGLPADEFDYITTYENSRNTKPMLEYYRDNVERVGLAPEEILMVGNDTKDDLPITELGCDIYLVTDHLINDIEYDISTLKHGSFQEFLQFVHELPDCK